MAGSLPLSSCVGVHHTGRVHPGANGQRLLLHVGRGPAGQVVLDPKHLRGPDAASVAAAAQSQKQEEEAEKVQQKKCDLQDGARLLDGRHFLHPHVEV